ncbi:MAG: radical SAM protein [Elusimicrobia bacterium]|nr:radical SAM protein [Elusimicrobiota bacterium]
MEPTKNFNTTPGMAGESFDDFKAPLFLAWQINSVCNLGCLHCCEEAGHHIPGEMTRDQIFNFLHQVREMGIPYVAISGGEPLLHPDFFEVAEFIQEAGISLKVETNGEFIDDRTVERFAALDFRSVQISLDGATSATHEVLRLKGNWGKSHAAVRKLVKKGVTTEIVFVPTSFNIHEVGPAIDMAYNLGCYGFYTGKIMRIGRAALNWDKLNPTEEQYKACFKILDEKTKQYKDKMKVYYYPYDVIEELKYRLQKPSASLLVIPNGNTKLIGPLPFICGNVKEQPLGEVWERYKKAWREPRVIEFTKRVIKDPNLLAESNKWQNIFETRSETCSA